MVQHNLIDHTGVTGVTGGVTVQDEGTPLSTLGTTLNFVGAGVAATGSGATKTVTIGGGTSILLAVVYNTAGGNDSTTSATQADVDATNAAITFTAPASGNVLVKATVEVNLSGGQQNCFLGVRESTTNLVNGTTGTFAAQGLAAVATEVLVHWEALISGISGGSHTYKLAYAVNGGVTMTTRASAANPMILSVWAAP